MASKITFLIYEINKTSDPLVSMRKLREPFTCDYLIHHKTKSMDQYNTWTVAVQNPTVIRQCPDIIHRNKLHIHRFMNASLNLVGRKMA